MTCALWDLRDVTLQGRSRPRLNAVSLELPAGATAVLGYSGAGKTSLLNVLTEFERPDSGSCRFLIDSTSDPQSRAPRRLPLFWVPQDHGLWPHLNVTEHLKLVAPTTEAARGAEALLQAFDLDEVAAAHPDQLSLGERARVSVARALISDAHVLVMDEPLAHVDPPRAGTYWKFLDDWCREHQTSLVFSTHQPEPVLRVARHVVCLEGGLCIYKGAVDDLYYRPPSRALSAFLGPANWITSDDVGTWVTADAPVPAAIEACVRPEQLEITRSDTGPLRVESTVFSGGFSEVAIRHEHSNQRRTFYHRPHAATLRAGDRVLLRVCLLLFVLVGLGGCAADAGENTLPVREAGIRSWMLPNDGPKIPAPRGLHVDGENELYILDDAGRVLVYDPQRKLDRQWHMPAYDVGKPEGLCVLKDGRVAVADTHYHRVVFFDDDGNVLGMLGEYGHGPSQFIYPVAVLQDDDGDFYVCEYGGNDRVQKFSPDGTFLLQIGAPGIHQGEFMRPSGAVWRDGLLYIVDAFNNRIQIFTDEGEFRGYFGGGDAAGAAGRGGELFYPYDIAQSSDGSLFVVEYKSNRVTCYAADGTLVGRFGSGGTTTGQFATPWGIAVDPQGRIYVADTGNRRMVELPL